MSEKHELFQIDQNNLDVELRRQVKLYAHFAEKLADAKMEHEQAQAEQDIAEAEVDKDIRENPENYGIVKITEPLVEKTIILSAKYQKARRNTITRKHAQDVTQAMVSALDHRKKALEGLVSLRLADYFAEPRAPKGAPREIFEEAEKVNTRRRVSDRLGEE